jgi:hypothetical protein
MPVRCFRLSICTFALALLALCNSAAGHDRCAHCGIRGPCRKICRLVTEEKPISITCWGCQCEDICLPGPSKPGCEHCSMVCAADDSCRHQDSIQTEPKRFVWKDWLPGSAKIYSKTRLMKKTVTKQLPAHKWVVEDVCDQCLVDVQKSTVLSAQDHAVSLPAENGGGP